MVSKWYRLASCGVPTSKIDSIAVMAASDHFTRTAAAGGPSCALVETKASASSNTSLIDHQHVTNTSYRHITISPYIAISSAAAAAAAPQASRGIKKAADQEGSSSSSKRGGELGLPAPVLVYVPV